MSREALEAAKAAKLFAKLKASLGIDDFGANDVYVATAARETFIGDAGTDTVSYHKATGPVTIQVDGSGFRGFAGGDQFRDIDNLIGSDFGDYVIGDERANTLAGLGGNDDISGGGGNDRLFGGAGEDKLFASGHGDAFVFMDGGTEDDLLVFATGGGSAEITTGDGFNEVEIRITDDEYFNVTITDFRPWFEAFGPGAVTPQEALNGDRLVLNFARSLGVDLAAPQFETIISQDRTDVTVRLIGDGLSGDIVLEEVGAYFGITPTTADFEFFVEFRTFSDTVLIPL